MTFKKGDLVMVVRPMPCCGSIVGIGLVTTVESIEPGDAWQCAECEKDLDEWEVAMHAEDDGIVTTRLIKINPPADDIELAADKKLEGVV